MNANIRIAPIGPAHQNLLKGMYDRFDPLGAALGLPPPNGEVRFEWILTALGHKINVAAFSPDGKVVGHCFLAPDTPGSAELAIFVDQEFRRRGIGTALVKAALARASAAGLERVWSTTVSRVALHLQQKCGFRVTNFVFPGVELEIGLPY